MIPGLPRERIHMVKNLKDMIICKFRSFVASAVAYETGNKDGSRFYSCVPLLEGKSDDGIVEALEDLFNKTMSS
jgi:hypothetical protein